MRVTTVGGGTMNPTLYVSEKTRSSAEKLLRKGTGDAAREAVALLLQDNSGGVGGTDAGKLLSQGLAEVIKRPHEALGCPVGSTEAEVRRAFRKQVIKRPWHVRAGAAESATAALFDWEKLLVAPVCPAPRTTA